MDYDTARQLLLNQGAKAGSDSQTVLSRLRQGKPPIPGHITSILLALKVVFEHLRGVSTLERDLAYSLHLLASDSRHQFDLGRHQGVDWPPLLDEDLTRIARAVRSIFAGNWE